MSSSEVPQVRPVRSGNVFEETMEHLLRLLRLGTFPPGTKLPAERDLAESLRVSRTTLREVLGELQQAGYVTVTRGRYGGTHVSQVLPTRRGGGALDPAEVEDLLTLRSIVEPAAAALAARRGLTEQERQRLRTVATDCAGAGVEQYRPLDARLHLTLAELGGSPSLTGVVADVRDRVNAMLDRIPLLPTNLVHSTDQHEAVVAAVLAGRPAAAEEAMHEHLEGTAALLRGFLS
ncbi:FadR/GntR family transcriptional regulator [Serinicoccus sediminis]|uniref:FadR/GntR family transcriptional regulator n=1 Tax=Serinicoccus sediminis TaxID=2306021 RepID=UPI00101EAF13|nr:FCD domain-containing protein [Serinicoccus sediminis]